MASTITPNENDVVSGRGSGANRHKGNLHFRKLIKDRKSYYLSLSKNLKMGVAREIYEEIASLDPPGRFLQKNPETDTWFQVKKDRALEKISQALREKPHAKKMNHAQLQLQQQQQQQMPKLANQSMNVNPDGSSHRATSAYPQHPSLQQQPFVQMHQSAGQGRLQVMPGLATMSMSSSDGSMPVNVNMSRHQMNQHQQVYQQHQQQQQQQPMNVSVSQSYAMGGNMYSNPNQGNQLMMYSQQTQQQQRQNFQQYQNQQQHPHSHQHSQHFPSNQPYSNANTVTLVPVQEPVNNQIIYTSAQGRIITNAQAHSHVPVQQVYRTEMPSIPEVPREYLVDTGTMYKRRESNAMQQQQQDSQMYINIPPPTMTTGSQSNPYYVGDAVMPTTPVHLSRQRMPYEQIPILPGHGSGSASGSVPLSSRKRRGVGIGDEYSNAEISSDDESSSIPNPPSNLKRKFPASPISRGCSPQSKRQNTSPSRDRDRDRDHYDDHNDEGETEKPSIVTITAAPSTNDKISLTLDTAATIDPDSTAPLVSPQNDDEKAAEEGTSATAGDAKGGKKKKEGSGLNTLSTAASMVAHQ